MKFSYVLPDPSTYRDWSEFDGDLAGMKQQNLIASKPNFALMTFISATVY